MISRHYDVCVGSSNLHVLVAVEPSKKIFNVSYRRTLPFYTDDDPGHPDTFYVDDICRVNAKLAHPTDAFTKHVYDHSPYIALGVSSVIAHYPRGVLVDLGTWRVRFSKGGNSMSVDDSTEEHLRLMSIFSVSTLPIPIRNKFRDYWMRFIWTCPDALGSIYNAIEEVPGDLSIKSMGKFMKDVKFVGVGRNTPMKDWSSMMTFMSSVEGFPWMVISGSRTFQEMKKVIDEYSSILLEHETIKKTTLQGLGLLGDFSLKIPMEEYDVVVHRLVTRSKGFYYVRTDEAENAFIRFENYRKLSLDSFRSRVDDGLLDLFGGEYNECVRRLHVLCALVIMRERLGVWTSRWVLGPSTQIRDLVSLKVVIPTLDVISNNFNPLDRSIVIHGLMASGKTTYLISLGLTIYLGQIGWPYLMGSSGVLCPYSAIVLVKNHDGDVFRKRSAFQTHVAQLSYALNQSPRALLLFDEPAASTQFVDAKIVIEDIISFYSHHQLVISTHTLIDSTDICRQSMNKHKLIEDWSQDTSTLMDWFKVRPKYHGKYIEYLRERVGESVTKRMRVSNLL